MAYAYIPRSGMLKLLDFAHVERDTLIAHRDRTFTLRRRFTGGGELPRAASLGKLRKNTKTIILEERFERKGLRGSLQVRFAFEEWQLRYTLYAFHLLEHKRRFGGAPLVFSSSAAFYWRVTVM